MTAMYTTPLVLQNPAPQSCLGKHPFKSKHDAEKVMQAKRKQAKHTALNSYKCIHCNHWHLGARNIK